MTTRTRKTQVAKAAKEEKPKPKAQTTDPSSNADKNAQAQAPEASEADNAQASTQPTEPAQEQPIQGDGSGEALPPVDGNQEREADPLNHTDEIPAIVVRTRRGIKSRRRAGFRITREGVGMALDALTDEQCEQLRTDPALEVVECTFPADEDEE